MNWGENGGIYFGYPSATTEGMPQWHPDAPKVRYVGDRHIVTVGPNGSGKSRRLLLPNLVDLTGWSMLVVDPKGELDRMTSRHRAAHGGHIVRLNPFDALGLGSDGFNPVAALDPTSDDFPDDAQNLGEAMVRIEGKDPHFSQSAQDLVTAIIMYVRLTMPGTGSLGDLRAILGKPTTDFRHAVNQMMNAGIEHDCEELVTKAGRFAEIDPDNKELNSVVSTALTQTRWLDSRPVKADLSRGAFNFSTMKERPTTVYLILPARRLGTHSTWLRLMIAAVLQSLMKDTRKAKVPVLFMLDEFAQLGHLGIIENNLAMMRGYGIKLWAIFQDLAQAKAIYRERWESFLSNAGVLNSFAPQDVVTASHLSQLTGQTTRIARAIGESRNLGQGGSESLNLSQIQMPLMLPQDLRNMDDGYNVFFSHKIKGTGRSYLPYPTALPHLKSICALDPGA
ncbi:type IV secretory system conjugative DNA transfer family protein [Paraburkholderia sp. RL18-103-BIB-C]|uniref:type IV secretory system conjugative DNA transfer family protein n=1 Tax=unclassified Paraburkholderia TaxID=2615204 RepID=UPI0038B7D092